MNVETGELRLNFHSLDTAVEELIAAEAGRTAFTVLVSGDLSETARELMSRYYRPGTWLGFIICPQWTSRWAVIGAENIYIYTHA